MTPNATAGYNPTVLIALKIIINSQTIESILSFPNSTVGQASSGTRRSLARIVYFGAPQVDTES